MCLRSKPSAMQRSPVLLLSAMSISIDWYFDFVSPYLYFSVLRLDELPAQVCCAVGRLSELLKADKRGRDAAKRKCIYRCCNERRFDALCAELGVDGARVDENKDALRLATCEAA